MKTLKNLKMLALIAIVALLVGLLPVSSAFAAGPAPVVLAPEEQSVLQPTTQIVKQTGADGADYVMAAYNGFYGRVVVEYNATMPSLNTIAGPISGAAADALVRTLSAKFAGATYTLPAAMDTNVYGGLVKSGLKSLQVSLRANELQVRANGKLVNVAYLDGLTEVTKMVEASEILTGTLPMGTADGINAGLAMIQAIGFDEWDIAVLVAENYRAGSPTITWPAHRDNVPVKLSDLIPTPVKPAASAPAAPAGTKKLATQVLAKEGPANVAERMSAGGKYSYQKLFEYCKNLQATVGWYAGMPIPLEGMANEALAYDIVLK